MPEGSLGVHRDQSAHWIGADVRAFESCQEVPKLLVPDNAPVAVDESAMGRLPAAFDADYFNWGKLKPAYYRRREEFREEARGYLRRIGLREADAKKYPDQLSGGMQQRVASRVRK